MAIFSGIEKFDPQSVLHIFQDKNEEPMVEEPNITTGITRSNISSTLTALSPTEIS